MNDVILSVKEARKIYSGLSKEVRALNGISLEIKRGSSTAVVGASGAGKSTLLHVMGGLDRPTSGKVELEGADLYKLSDKERSAIRNSRIGFVFQFYHLLPEFTALENVLMPGLIRGSRHQSAGAGGRGPVREKAKKMLQLVGLKERSGHKPFELSGGESQRVAIARALINDPEILLCDEPTGNLDSKTSQSIYELLFGLQRERKMTLVIVTHDENISRSVQEMIHVRDGKIA
jgi:lipoprotein-releasing system ATP-binding protein